MNHHCTWLNVCIGHYNQAQYLMYLAASLASSALSVQTLYQGINRYYGQAEEEADYRRNELVVLSTPELWNLNFCLGLSFGLSTILLYFLVRQVGRQRLDLF